MRLLYWAIHTVVCCNVVQADAVVLEKRWPSEKMHFPHIRVHTMHITTYPMFAKLSYCIWIVTIATITRTLLKFCVKPNTATHTIHNNKFTAIIMKWISVQTIQCTISVCHRNVFHYVRTRFMTIVLVFDSKVTKNGTTEGVRATAKRRWNYYASIWQSGDKRGNCELSNLIGK